MGGSTKRRLGAVAITGLMIAGVVGVTSMSASGADPTPASGIVTIPYGTVTINLTTGAETYEFKPAAGAVVYDPITPIQPCATVDAQAGNYIRVSPTPGSSTFDVVQIRNNALGVNTGNTSCGSSAAAVISGTELLKVDLAPTGTATLPTGVYLKSANLKLTRVKSGNLTYRLDSDAIVTKDFAASIEVKPTINTVDDLFTSITIGNSQSRKDNEGISLATGTTFELVTLDPRFDVAVNCNEFVTKTGSSTDAASSATYERLDNKTGTPAECQEVGVKVQLLPATTGTNATPARVYWNNAFTAISSPTTAQTVQAYFTIVWTPTSNLTTLNRKIDYDAEGTAAGEVDMQWCAGKSASGIPILPAYSGPGANRNGTPDYLPDDTAPWCLVDDTRVLLADGTIAQTQKLFGSGDPWAR